MSRSPRAGGEKRSRPAGESSERQLEPSGLKKVKEDEVHRGES